MTDSPTPAPPESAASVAIPAAEPAQTITPGDVAAPAPAAPVFLPDGTQLMLTLAAKVWLTALLGDGANDDWPGPQTPRQDLTVLFFASHGPDVWLCPGRDADTGKMIPLVNRPNDLQFAVAKFADERLTGMTIRDIGEAAWSLWLNEHATQVIPVQKKSQAEQFPMMTTAA